MVRTGSRRRDALCPFATMQQTGCVNGVVKATILCLPFEMTEAGNALCSHTLP